MLLRLKEVLFMNNRGQSLIMFILILPIIVLFIAFLVDSSISMMEKNKVDGIITSNMQEALNNNITDAEKIENVIIKNEKIDVSVTIIDNNLSIKARSNKKSVFGKILNFSWYKLEFNYCGNYLDKKINKNCG